MSKLEGRKVLYAVAHGPIKVPTSGSVGPTLTSKGDSSSNAVKMTILEGCIELFVTKPGTTITNTIYVPLSNFSHFQLEEKLEKNSKA